MKLKEHIAKTELMYRLDQAKQQRQQQKPNLLESEEPLSFNKDNDARFFKEIKASVVDETKKPPKLDSLEVMTCAQHFFDLIRQGMTPEDINAYCRKHNWSHQFVSRKPKGKNNSKMEAVLPWTLFINVERDHPCLDSRSEIVLPVEAEILIGRARTCAGYEDQIEKFEAVLAWFNHKDNKNWLCI